ncbi:hypothetical protein PoB_006828700 [Plakobranchus ocellatus]|uniref:Uncharacterized protein n=1 Tax=Plakobranchus ocellatus TaxID=259542 RepID=A0AAV4DCM1_9GAST|nr:hypothetical protein PoB_006828700 [Plakobranchus ocellatus]
MIRYFPDPSTPSVQLPRAAKLGDVYRGAANPPRRSVYLIITEDSPGPRKSPPSALVSTSGRKHPSGRERLCLDECAVAFSENVMAQNEYGLAITKHAMALIVYALALKDVALK